MNQYPIFVYITLFSPVVPISIGITRITILNSGMKILLFYLIFAFVADIYLLWFVRGYHFTLGLYHVYYLIEYIFIISIINIWQESHGIKRLFQIILFFYILFWIIAKVTFEPLTGLYTIIACTSQVLITLCAGYTFFVVIDSRMQHLMNNYRFWVLLSFIVYYSGTLFVIALRGILIHYSTENILLVSSIDWSLMILFNILFAIGFLCPQTQT